MVAKEADLLRRHLSSGLQILDAGCGDGRITFRMLDELSIAPARAVMLDINPECLCSARRNLRVGQAGDDRCLVTQGSIFALPHHDGVFDAVISLGDVLSLAGGGSVEDGLREFRRVARPGGKLLFSLVTQSYLLRAAASRGRPEKVSEIRKTGTYTEWNQQFGEGVFKSLGDPQAIEERLRTMGLDPLQLEQVHIDWPDIPARVLVACRRV